MPTMPAQREAEAALLAVAKELDRSHPGAAASLREGLEDTLKRSHSWGET